ncbi:MAG: ABC transporter permease [Oscillospiraceae bacterium]|nr:ABC transporter permease [Oscillospiraceae bacterium]MCL2278507.1 ABC transporter permease [Oscillospiraceae bacterium]
MKIDMKTWAKKNVILLFLILLVLGFGVTTSQFFTTWRITDIFTTSPFFTSMNLINLTTQMAINAMLAAGLTYVIILGGIDISVGSVAALSGIVASVIARDVPVLSSTVPGSILILIGSAFVVGTICGSINGIMITKFRVVPMIATLAMLTIARGLSFVVADGTSVFGIPSAFSWLGAARLIATESRPTGWIPVITLFVTFCVTIMAILLSKTVFGRHVYATGSNRAVAHLGGINTGKVILLGHIICSIAAAMGGALNASRLQSGQPAALDGFELFAIAATVLSGTSLYGGVGSVGRAMFGVAIIAVINNGMNLLQVHSHWQRIVIGLIILFAVALDMWQKKKKS